MCCCCRAHSSPASPVRLGSSCCLRQRQRPARLPSWTLRHHPCAGNRMQQPRHPIFLRGSIIVLILSCASSAVRLPGPISRIASAALDLPAWHASSTPGRSRSESRSTVDVQHGWALWDGSQLSFTDKAPGSSAGTACHVALDTVLAPSDIIGSQKLH